MPNLFSDGTNTENTAEYDVKEEFGVEVEEVNDGDVLGTGEADENGFDDEDDEDDDLYDEDEDDDEDEDEDDEEN